MKRTIKFITSTLVILLLALLTTNIAYADYNQSDQTVDVDTELSIDNAVITVNDLVADEASSDVLQTYTYVTDLHNNESYENLYHLAQYEETPDVNIDDILNPPDEDAGWQEWFYYILLVFVWIMYNVVARIIPSSTSWTVPAMLYRIANLILRDRAKNGGKLDIKPDPDL